MKWNLDRRHDWTEDEVNHYNCELNFPDDDIDEYVCIKCRELTCRDESYSNGYKDLHCCSCVTEFAKKENLTRMMYIHRHVWKDVR